MYHLILHCFHNFFFNRKKFISNKMMNDYESLDSSKGCIQRSAMTWFILMVVFLVTTIALLIVAIIYIGKGKDAELNTKQTMPINGPVHGKIDAAAAMNGELNHKPSPYYRHLNFFDKDQKISDTLIYIPEFQTYQQTFGWSCGAAAALMVMNLYGDKNTTEDDLAKEIDLEHGANVEQVVNLFKTRNYDVPASSLLTEPDNYFKDQATFVAQLKEWLKGGVPVIIKLGGHWSVIFGYDDMGTENTQDDMIILGDSWDTHDHQQEGVIIYAFDYFWNLWSDSSMRAAPGIYQQFVVAKKKA